MTIVELVRQSAEDMPLLHANADLHAKRLTGRTAWQESRVRVVRRQPNEDWRCMEIQIVLSRPLSLAL